MGTHRKGDLQLCTRIAEIIHYIQNFWQRVHMMGQRVRMMTQVKSTWSFINHSNCGVMGSMSFQLQKW